MRGEGDDPSGDPEADAVYDNLGQVFDYYSDTFGRDSYDDAGADLIASINFCETPGTPMINAYWDGTQMVFGDGYASSLDITAHELTHAVTERPPASSTSASRARSTSRCRTSSPPTSTPTTGRSARTCPTARSATWRTRERRPAAARAHRRLQRDAQRRQPFNDHGGVHYNSGIPNHAYYLMVQAIGRDAAEAIVYRALTEELEEDSNFEDFRTASLEVARELWGEDSPEYRGHRRVLRGGRARRDVGSSRGGGMLMRMPSWPGSRSCCSPAAATTTAVAAASRPRSSPGPMTYERGGGIAGRRDRLIVQPDGTAELTVRDKTKAVELTDKELDELGRDLEHADLASLPKDSTSKKAVPDTFGYRVTYDGTTVTTDDPACPSGSRGLVRAARRARRALRVGDAAGRASPRAARAPRAAPRPVSGGAPGSGWTACTRSRPAWRSALRSTRATSRSPSRNGST